MSELPTETGWYMPTAPAPDDFWNPYYLNDQGDWFEAQRDGHVYVEVDQIELPIGKLAFDRGRESAATGANVVGREALIRALALSKALPRVEVEVGGKKAWAEDIGAVADTLLSPSGPLRDEAVVKAEAWDECVAAIDTACMVKHVGMIENPYRAAALLATTTTDVNDDEGETQNGNS